MPLLRLFVFMEEGMKVVVNGEPTEIRDGSNVAGLLEELQISRDRVAVEVGMEIVPKACYDTHTLQESDKIEIVQFVGGG
jgi:sulfur carrier protein